MNKQPKPPSKTVMIFVYGSLLRGETNEYCAPVFRRYPAILAEPATLYSFGIFPAVTLEADEHSKHIRGEVLVVDEAYLPEFDHLEGYHENADESRNLYTRSQVKVMIPSANKTPCLAYIYHMSKDSILKYGGTRLNIDDWRYRDVCAN